MPQSYAQEAVVKRPPRGNGSTERGEPFVTNITTVSISATFVIPNAGATASALPLTGAFVTWVADVDCYIRVGTSTLTSATTSDWVIPAYTVVEWRHDETNDTHFTARSVSGSGTIRRYISNS